MWKHAAVGLGIGCAATAQAQPNFISASRSVSAETGSGTQAFTTVALGSWSQTASSAYSIGSASAFASQVSDIGPDWISYRGVTRAGNLNAYTAIATNTLAVTFSLPSATPYELLRMPTAALSNVTVQLLQGQGTVFSYWYSSGGGTLPVSATGSLPAGTFTLRILMASEAPWSYPDWIADGAAELTFHIPAPGAASVLAAALVACGSRRRRKLTLAQDS